MFCVISKLQAVPGGSAEDEFLGWELDIQVPRGSQARYPVI
jgi:hypothetical protein